MLLVFPQFLDAATPYPVLNIEAYGALAGEKTLQVAKKNTKAITAALSAATNVSSGPVIVEISAGKSYWALGGILGENLQNVIFKVNGVLNALPDLKNWPLASVKKYEHFLKFINCNNLTIYGGSNYIYPLSDLYILNMTEHPPTASLINGQGVPWWNKYIISTQHPKRPKLLLVTESKNILIENITLLNSPSFHILLDDVVDVEVRFVHIQVDCNEQKRLKTF